MSIDTPNLTFQIDRQHVEPVIIQFREDSIVWTLRPGSSFAFNALQPKLIPGRGINFPSVGLDVKCSCGKLDRSSLFDVIDFSEDDLFGGYILRGVTSQGTPHDHLDSLSLRLLESYEFLLEQKRNEA